MKILVSNDDGIAATGIRSLVEALSIEHEVYVIAPDRERSAAGHSLTLHTPLRVEELDARFGAKRVWATTGTPGDCVKIAICAILEEHEKPDLVISGINHGPNLGSDILYSGTVSCAMEGAMLGYPSIAVSLCSMAHDPLYFTEAANFVAKLIPKISTLNFPKKTILNINTPALEESDVAGVAITRLGNKMFTNDYEKRADPRGKLYYWLAGELTSADEEDGTDISALRHNKVSITPVTFEMTHKSIMAELEHSFCKGGICEWYGYNASASEA
ncbi:5'-nucleotidase [Candidatus Gastranaerophilus sp. (ex Termes propinquus)]|nr:5'-nucleotidase [Candidatus Gastranaerophilus sp. (ex Termes propinquus)]